MVPLQALNSIVRQFKIPISVQKYVKVDYFMTDMGFFIVIIHKICKNYKFYLIFFRNGSKIINDIITKL